MTKMEFFRVYICTFLYHGKCKSLGKNNNNNKI